jgi:hypothetical protein
MPEISHAVRPFGAVGREFRRDVGLRELAHERLAGQQQALRVQRHELAEVGPGAATPRQKSQQARTRTPALRRPPNRRRSASGA